jgi:hypothetical protein
MNAKDAKRITDELGTLAHYRSTGIFVMCSRIHGVTDDAGQKIYGLQINHNGQKVLSVHSADADKLQAIGIAKIAELRRI